MVWLEQPLVIDACQMCEAKAGKLYRVPPKRRVGERGPQAVCVFCYIRLVGIRPVSSSLVGVAEERPARRRTAT